MKCRLLLAKRRDDASPENPKGTLMPVGTEIEHPDAWKLVIIGVAEPADTECATVVEQQATPETLAKARWYAVRADRGIHPDDYQAYAEGRMVGYDSNGQWLPGPNYEAPVEEDDDE